MKNLLVVLILSVATTTSCQNKKEQMSTYEWTATRSAPKDYPMEVVNGGFLFEDGSSLYIPKKGVVANGWGKQGPTHIVGDPLKPIPHELDITYLSSTENQFYGGKFQLPVEKLQKLFETELPGIFNNPAERFNELNVALGFGCAQPTLGYAQPIFGYARPAGCASQVSLAEMNGITYSCTLSGVEGWGYCPLQKQSMH